MFRQAPSFPYHELGIVEDGTTASRAISKDSYVIWKGSSYFASTDILQGATLEEDVNLTAIPDGVINGVVDAAQKVTYSLIVNTYEASAYAEIRVIGNIAYVHIHPWAGGKNFKKLMEDIPSKYLPIDADSIFPVAFYSNSTWTQSKSGAALRVSWVHELEISFMSPDNSFTDASMFSASFSYIIKGETT